MTGNEGQGAAKHPSLPQRARITLTVRSMHLTGADERGWAELRSCQDDETLGMFVRLLRNAYERRDRSGVRAQAVRLLLDLPGDLAAAHVLMRRLRDLGE